MRKIILLSLTLAMIFVQYSLSQTNSKGLSLLVSARVTTTPPQIIFRWPGDKTATNYTVFRKPKISASWGTTIATLTGSDSTWTDNTLKIGDAYEYNFLKYQGTSATAVCYLYAGINVPVTENRGTVLLLVDESYKTKLQGETVRLMMDMVGDGWVVRRKYIQRTDSVKNVKNLIKTLWLADKTISTVFLLGHIPVPYSGMFSTPPDGHDATHGGHTGAWPADVYYGELTGYWTDTGTDTTATRKESWNLPGDGKFDQTTLPSDPELAVGRVDLYNMPSFSADDTFLVKRYLDKNHRFRMGLVNAARRGLIDDNFTGYPLVAQGWRSFSTMFGDTNIFDNTSNGKDYFTTMKNESYLWSCGAGAGWYTSCSGVGSSTNFVTDSVQTVFTMLTGSYFGDWYYPDNLLRAAIASKSPILVSFWGGIPNWELHTMALGDNIGYCAKISQINDGSLYFNGNFNYSSREVHIALMGDPTLRMHIVKPPSKLHVTGSTTKHLAWSKSKDIIVGYNIYRSDYIWGNFTKINTALITDSVYNDAHPLKGVNVYMVRAVKLETSGSGTYYNMSQGIFDSTTFLLGQEPILTQVHDRNRIYPNPSDGKITIETETSENNEVVIDIYSQLGQNIVHENKTSSDGKLTSHFDLTAYGKGIYFIRISSGHESVTKKVIIR